MVAKAWLTGEGVESICKATIFHFSLSFFPKRGSNSLDGRRMKENWDSGHQEKDHLFIDSWTTGQGCAFFSLRFSSSFLFSAVALGGRFGNSLRRVESIANCATPFIRRVFSSVAVVDL